MQQSTLFNILFTLAACPGMAVALGVLGSTYLEMGEVTQACELLETSITINRTIFGQKHPSTCHSRNTAGQCS